MELFFEFLTQQWMLATALAVVVGLYFHSESRRAGSTVTPQQAINMINSESAVVVDLRDSKEYQAGHIVDAQNIPAAKMEARMAELEPHRSKPIILVCKMGQHSSSAGKQLSAKGFEKVYRMSGGMMEWGSLQLPLVSK
jgi:rhodanese-related sulfurtransferase